jgi:hypothetical protein
VSIGPKLDQQLAIAVATGDGEVVVAGALGDTAFVAGAFAEPAPVSAAVVDGAPPQAPQAARTRRVVRALRMWFSRLLGRVVSGTWR